MQASDRVPPSSGWFPLHAAIASVVMPVLVAFVAFAPWNLQPHEGMALLYGAAIIFPFIAATAPPLGLILFLVGWGMARWSRRPWVAYPTVLVLLVAGCLVLYLMYGKR